MANVLTSSNPEIQKVIAELKRIAEDDESIQGSGSFFPDGKPKLTHENGEAVDLHTRIVAEADVFSGMSEYHRAWALRAVARLMWWWEQNESADAVRDFLGGAA